MERPIFKPVGTPVEQLDTPALVVDLTVLERNIETLHAFFRQRQPKVRPHVESHRCPAIAHKQLAAGGAVGGICVTTVGQAEVFAEHGFHDIFVANALVTTQKINRLCALAHHAKMTVAVDHPKNVQALSEAATAHGVTLYVVVDINTRLYRCGVEPGHPSVDLVRTIREAQHLNFAGLMTYEGPMPAENPGEVAADSRKWIQQVLDTREMVEKAGIHVSVVSVGGTYNYEIAGTMAGVTEVLAGSYALMDSRYCQFRRQFKPAARVLTTVMSRPEPGTAIIDAGQKAIGSDTGLPMAEDLPDAAVVSLSAEHGRLRLPGDVDGKVSLGDKVWLTPWDIGTCVNLYDYLHAVRDGKLEVIWDIAARGRYR
ncbi:MAG: alanine racemase [Nitrospinae bacterium]|nr:alanine racemase [Nitrospinota bacterium]